LVSPTYQVAKQRLLLSIEATQEEEEEDASYVRMITTKLITTLLF